MMCVFVCVFVRTSKEMDLNPAGIIGTMLHNDGDDKAKEKNILSVAAAVVSQALFFPNAFSMCALDMCMLYFFYFSSSHNDRVFFLLHLYFAHNYKWWVFSLIYKYIIIIHT